MDIPGAIYPIVPFSPIEIDELDAKLECPILVDLELNTRLAIPKSPKYAFISASMRILLGFKSQ
jgi:hypothetical protein